MRAHETQITVDGEFFALSNGLGQRASGTEYYTLLSGTPGALGSPGAPGAPGPRSLGDPYERDLFAR
jgi:N-acetyl-1-D-myo-inositol-2-amino-2-deoxy-alpha-D-glucopyranoside deacetylase